jgi:hypothetical protein
MAGVLSKVAVKGIENVADFLKSFSNKVYYHFSTSDIKEFDPYPGYDSFGEFDHPGSKFKGRGVTYFTSDPKYANKIGSEIKGFENEDFYNFDFSNPDERDYFMNPDEFPSGDVIYPVRIKDKNIFSYKNKSHIKKLEKEGDYKWLEKEIILKDLSPIESGDFRTLESPEIKKRIKRAGYSGYKTSEPGTVGLFYPDKGDVRSVFAKFDPKKASSGNILASGLVGYGAFGGLED